MKRRRSCTPNFFGVFFDFPSDLRAIISSYSSDSFCKVCKTCYPTQISNCLFCLKERETVKCISNNGFHWFYNKYGGYNFQWVDMIDQHSWEYIKPIVKNRCSTIGLLWSSHGCQHKMKLSVIRGPRRSRRLQKNSNEVSDWWTLDYYAQV